MSLANFSILFLEKLSLLENLRILTTDEVIYLVVLKLFGHNSSFNNSQLTFIIGLG